MGIKIFAENGKLIHIGRRKEHLASVIIFDVSKQLDLGLGGAFKILVLQDGELSEIIPVAANDLNTTNKTLQWTIVKNNVLKEGKGRCQIVYTIGSIVSKSEIYDFIVTEGFDHTVT